MTSKEQESKMKDLAYAEMIRLGKEYQKAIANPISELELSNMNDRAKDGIKKLLTVNRLKAVLDDINSKKISSTTAVRAHSEYEKWIHLQMLAELTADEELKEWVANKKEQARYKNV